ncbi:MAG: sigma-70 family RNA polymerase sigma factor [Clostridia bacterium]|nr:sigma-70 family RNA polymerase sigma factor [Clostridia bacterium]
MLDDSKIIELFFERSEQAIVELSNKYGSVCKRTAKNILGNDLDAEECVNESYLGAWNTIPPQKPDVLSSYVCRIVRNLAIKKYHSNTATKRNGAYDVVLDEIEECFSSSLSVENEIESKEITFAINKFLSSLDKESRVMFVKRYWYSDSLEDLSKAYNMSKHNVSVRLFRIRKRLKVFLSKEGVFL